MIKIQDISFAYNDRKVVDDLSIDICPGNWLGVIGPNGAGKTTLLNLISGSLLPSSGEILIDGKGIGKYPRTEMAKMIAVVPQTSSFAFSFTVSDIILMGRSPYIKRFGFETAEDIAISRESMQITDTLQFKDRRIDELSGGERQRVLIARALTQRPKVLLLDEPTTFLDIKHQADIMNILTDLNKNYGLTIISAIHDVNLAVSYCKEIALLHNGKIAERGRPEDVITYANLKKIFDAELYVGVNEFNGKPYYVPLSGKG